MPPLAVGALIPSALFATSSADARPLPAFGTQNYCNPYQPNIDARYVFTGPFTNAERDLGRDAFDDWDQVLDNAANSLYASSEVPFGSHDVEVRRVPNGAGSNAPCGGTVINIDSPILRVFRHEIGHNHGLNHVGASHDLRTGLDPTMDGCGSGTAIRAEDHANVLYRRSSGRITPNGGFENAGLGWLVTNGSGTLSSTNPVQGNSSMQLSSGAVAEAQARVVSGPGSLRTRVSYKHSGSNSASYKFEYREAPHNSGTPSCGNAWTPSNYRWDVAPTPGPWIQMLNRSLGPSGATWISRTDPIGMPTPTQDYGTLSPRGMDFKISYWSSNNTNLIDNLEVYRA